MAGAVSADVRFSSSGNAAFDRQSAADPSEADDSLGPAPAVGIRALSQPIQRQVPDVRYEPAWLAGLPPAEGDAEWSCLAEAIYFEARGESVRGQFAVAEVILNRVESPQFPTTVCSVVHQGTGKRYQCQFTYTCDGRKETIAEPGAWRRAGKIARLALDGAPRRLTDGATYYHTSGVRPRWARRFELTAQIGAHLFYRAPLRVSSR